jgi:preprotein translocase subunit SecE
VRRFQNYLKDVVAELKKVTWPTWDELKGATVAVILFSVISSLYVLGVDSILLWGVNQITSIFGA